MRSREEDIKAVKALCHKQECTVFWSSECGGEVHRIWDTFILFSVPLYGGEPYYVKTFGLNEVEELVNLVWTWT